MITALACGHSVITGLIQLYHDNHSGVVVYSLNNTGYLFPFIHEHANKECTSHNVTIKGDRTHNITYKNSKTQ